MDEVMQIVRDIENGNRRSAAEQINDHAEPTSMVLAVLATLCDHTGYGDVTVDHYRDALACLVRTLNADTRTR